MFVTQLSIFIENRFGRIAELTRLLADNGIDMRTISIADTKEFGIVRIIADNPEKAAEVLSADGWIFQKTPVIAVVIPDVPGGMADVLDALTEKEIGVEYIYAVIAKKAETACMIFRVKEKNSQAAIDVLNEKGYTILSQQEVNAI